MVKINYETDVCGTSLKSYIPSLYSTNELIELLGDKPERGHHEDKVTREWTLIDEDSGVIATIYDWKQYRKYGDDVKVEWNIGGFDGRAIDLVRDVLSGTVEVS